ncbi:MAG: hypothetical protein ABJF04_02175 [Reichenbachiella sp.]|uniref:hypothetical protein n=1 Tax=Reichenbachiella sp. TaxID=2184521 RepID=UPI0032646F3F
MTGLIALDVFISLIFIYLLYSLWATAIVESIAALFGSRAKNLLAGINRMLADDAGWFKFSIVGLFYTKPKGELMNAFYKHPSIKYLGGNGINKAPSYIKPERFGSVIIDILSQGGYQEDSDNIKASLKVGPEFNVAELEEDKAELQADIEELNYEIKELEDKKATSEEIEALKIELEVQQGALERANTSITIVNSLNDSDQVVGIPSIEKETLYQLAFLWKQASGDVARFKLFIEDWFNDQMDRIGGWYKRKIQYLTFVVGLIIALAFGVDTIGIAEMLMENDGIREMFVTNAENLSKQYSDVNELSKDTEALQNSISEYNMVFSSMKNKSGNKGIYFLGCLITAFALSLGAPFWFDLLNKLVKIRSSLRIPSSESEKETNRKTSDNHPKNAVA